MGVVVASDMVVDTEERPTAGDARDDIADVVPDDLAGIDVDEGPQAVQAGACPAKRDAAAGEVQGRSVLHQVHLCP